MELHTLQISLVEVGRSTWHWRVDNVEPWLAAPGGRIVHATWAGYATGPETAYLYAMAQRKRLLDERAKLLREKESV